MESLVLANEAAVAEVRKHAKADEKSSKDWFTKTKAGVPAATTDSITSSGIERVLRRAASTAKPTDSLKDQSTTNAPKNASWSEIDAPLTLAPVPIVFQSHAADINDQTEGSNAVDQQPAAPDRAQVINHLLALWAPNVSAMLPPAEAKVLGDDQSPRYHSDEANAGSTRDGQQEEAETIDLFPRRSRPY